MTRESSDIDAQLGWLSAAQPMPASVAKQASSSDGADVGWDEHADAIVSRATAAAPFAESETAALLAAPPLRGEPGESQRGSKGVELKSVAGQGDDASTNSVGAAAMSESERPKPSQRPASIRPSLKEMAERHSKTPPPPSVRSPTSTPLPTSVPAAAPLPAGLAPVSTPLPAAAPSSGPGVGPASDSSPNSVAPSSAVPSSAVPSSAAPSSAVPSNVVPMVAAKKPANEGGSSAGMGILIALVGVAAAAGLFFFLRTKPADKPAPMAERAATAQVEEAKPVESAAAAPAKTAEKEDGTIDIGAIPDATATPENTGTAPDPGAIAQNDPSKPAPIVKVEPDGTLHDAMEKVTGPVEEKTDATPAAADPQPKNLPDRPAQGSVTAAVGSVMGAARACVAGGEDVSRATITFGSSGAVKSVAVSGWAAGKPASSCIQSAMKGANVGPFTQPTFTFGVTVRP